MTKYTYIPVPAGLTVYQNSMGPATSSVPVLGMRVNTATDDIEFRSLYAKGWQSTESKADARTRVWDFYLHRGYERD